MNYIYDVMLNFNKDFYNFFEWEKSDSYINVKKIPLFVVNDKVFNSLKYNDVIVDNEFINLINKKTYIYSRNGIGPSIIISNKKEAIGVLFDNNGYLIKRSGMLLDEEEEVIDECYELKEYAIPIIKEKEIIYENISRNDKEKKKYLVKYIGSEENNINLKYLYYDYFERDESNSSKIKKELINEINSNWNSKFNSLYETVKMFKKINS